MQLTEEQIKSNLAAFEHAMRTQSVKDIQVYDSGDWIKKENDRFYFDIPFRIRPTPRLRPWKPEEVPVGAIVRVKDAAYIRGIISFVDNGCLNGTGTWTSFANALTNYEHSTDGGKTWLPCGVMEEGE